MKNRDESKEIQHYQRENQKSSQKKKRGPLFQHHVRIHAHRVSGVSAETPLLRDHRPPECPTVHPDKDRLSYDQASDAEHERKNVSGSLHFQKILSSQRDALGCAFREMRTSLFSNGF